MTATDNKFGLTCIYFFYNIIKLMGEQWVRDSFESLKGQTDDIIVTDYAGESILKKLAEEFGFRYFEVEKTHGITFNVRKCLNRGTFEAKYDYVVKVTADTIYPKGFVHKTKELLKNIDHNKEILQWLFRQQNKDGTTGKQWGHSYVHYKPFLMKAKGWDEEPGKYIGEHEYESHLMIYVFGLIDHPIWDLYLIHRWHPPRRETMVRRGVKISMREVDGTKYPHNHKLIKMKQNFDEGIKLVKNSYW